MAQERPYATWLESDRWLPRRFVRPVLQFTHVEAASGIFLLAAAIAAVVWANLPIGESYEAFWEIHFELNIGSFHIEESLRELVNDGLMAVFFFVVGLEIKRELAVGELRDPRTAALPAIAALGGMVVPALIYVAFVGGGDGAAGWGIPMATDIAFSLGVVALLGTRVPVSVKLFLLALAIADDIGAISVIAVFYTEEIRFGWLIASIAGLSSVAVAARIGIRSLLFYSVVGFFVWFATLESGVHATLAGVALGLMTPVRPLLGAEEADHAARQIIDTYPALDESQTQKEKTAYEATMLAAVAKESVSPLARLEHALHPWSSYVIVPIFALANAGVRFVDLDVGEALLSPITLGIAVGLVAGKIGGISLLTWLAVRLRIGRLPSGATWRHIFGVSALAGIGFTVSLFIASLAFTDTALTDLARIGIFVGSIVAGLVGYLVLRGASPRSQRESRRGDPVAVEA